MCICEVLLQLVIVEVVLRVSTTISAITDVTALMFLPAMTVQLIITVKSLATKSTLWMTFETRLIYSSRSVVAILFVPPQVRKCKEFVFMSEDFLVPCAKIAHYFVVLVLYMSMQIGPTETCDVAVLIRTVVSEQEYCVLQDFIFLVLDAKIAVNLDELGFVEVLKALVARIGEDDKGRFSLLHGLVNVTVHSILYLLDSEHKLWFYTMLVA